MSDLVIRIARTLAEFDLKDWDTILLPEQMPYVARAILVASAVREHTEEEAHQAQPIIEFEGLGRVSVA
jgi:predicted N-acyltransferase